MKRSFLLIVTALLSLAAPPLVSGADSKAVTRGKYLVEQLGQCADCHTPRNDKGELDRNRWLQGAMLDFKPAQPIPNWAPASASIAGLPRWSEAQAIKFFETGIDPDGKSPRPPMPAYKLSHEDAAAIVAYLKSLKPAI